jgi:CRISPR-associated protein Cmr2
MNHQTQDTYWRSKLDAFMHDPVCKALDVATHEKRALAQRLTDAFASDEYYNKTADFNAAAADRLPFPHAGKLKAPFDGREHPFRHPLDGRVVYRFEKPLYADLADEISQTNRPHLECGDARSDFIARWRFWKMWAQERHPGLAFLPADTRIPDHTIWNHLGLTSAFQGCFQRDPQKKAALLLFSLGPVQPLIAAARRIGDLWSGSYLLSYLVSTALGEIAREFGPDHILFPSAWGQPLLDLQLKPVLESARIRQDEEKSLWDQLWWDNSRARQRYLLPSLPNRFLALLPASEADATAARLADAIHSKIAHIGIEVMKHLDAKLGRNAGGIDFDPEKMEQQLKASLDIHWQTLTLPGSVAEARTWGDTYLPNDASGQPHAARRSLDALDRMWASLPDGSKTGYGMVTPSVSWPLSFSVLSWALDAVKQTRLFDAWCQHSGFQRGTMHNKDALTGKEEIVLILPEASAQSEIDIQKLGYELAGSRALFRPGERMGALTLVKRLWHAAYLCRKYPFRLSDFRMPDTRQLSNGKPFHTEKDDDEESSESGGYIAALAFDGDEMGKWISGEKTPALRHQLATKAFTYFEEEGLVEKDIKISAEDFLNTPRPLNPSFHLQFSEALANFGLYAARRVVEAFDGRLIYAGGDDVLALLPAANALRCAEALRAAFRGETETLAQLRGVWRVSENEAHKEELQLFDVEKGQRGFLRLHPDLREGGALRNEPLGFDVMVPGPATEVSCGIAVGHNKSPLQDLVRAAQAAEKRAKNRYDRAAFAITVNKRSGETVQWGAKWASLEKSETAQLETIPPPSPALTLFGLLMDGLQKKKHARRLPYKLCAQIEPYLSTSASDDAFAKAAGAVLQTEFSHALRDLEDPALAQRILATLAQYWDSLDAQYGAEDSAKREENDQRDPTTRKIADVLNLLKVAAWLSRQ